MSKDDRIAELEAELTKQRLNNISMQESVASAGALLAETEERLAKCETALNKCTVLLEKHWPASMSCNGLLQVAGHLGVILAELAKHETFNSIAHKMYPKRMLIVDGAVEYAEEMKAIPAEPAAAEKLRPPETLLPECVHQDASGKGWVKCKAKIGKKPDGVFCDKNCKVPFSPIDLSEIETLGYQPGGEVVE